VNEAKTKDRKARKEKRKDKKAKRELRALPPPDRIHDPALLDASRIQWQRGDWASLAALRAETLADHPERARLALIVAAAHSQLGDTAQARTLAQHAMDWGCSRTLAAQVLISSLHNSLGRLAAAAEDPSVDAHFATAIRLVEPKADVPLLARSRQLREATRQGLFTDAANLLDIEFKEVAQAPADHAARVSMLDTRLMELKHELSLSLARGQIYGDQGGSNPDDLARRSVAQLGQDLWVLERLNHKRGGYFVEFGATDGILLSNTLLLEREFGWKGLCAEPNPDFFAQLQRNRGCTLSPACISARTGDVVDFILADEYGGIASYAGTDHNSGRRTAFEQGGKVISLTTVSLDDFLRQNGAPHDIDYLSVDTEGNEFDILAAFPFENWKISLITVEHNFTAQRESIRQLLEIKGYTRTMREWDDWYELQNGIT